VTDEELSGCTTLVIGLLALIAMSMWGFYAYVFITLLT
jgi:hypothetical protein